MENNENINDDDNIEVQVNKPKTSKSKIIRTVVLLLSLLIFVIIMICSFGQIKDIGDTLLNTNYWLILLAFGVLLVYLVLWQLSMHYIVKSRKCNIKFKDTMYIAGTEFFFNSITPFSTGGQPFQVYGFSQKKVKPSESTSILMINFFAYQLVLNIFSLVALIVFGKEIISSTDNMVVFIIMGFSANFLILILLVLIATSKKVCALIHRFLVFLCKAKWIKKHLESKITGFDNYTLEVQEAFKFMIKDFKMLVVVFVIKVLALIAFYSIPFFCFLAIGVDLSFSDVFYIIAMTSFCLTMVIWIPTPGATGGAELAFATLFMGLPGIDQTISLSGMIIWRFMTYYLVMIYGLIMYLLLEKSVKKDENRNIH